MSNRRFCYTSRRRQIVSTLRAEQLEDRRLLAGDTQILLLGSGATASSGADTAVMSFLESNFGADNVAYKQASVANNTSDLVDIDVLVLSSTASSGAYRDKYHDAEVPILNWEEAIMDSGAGEFGMSSVRMTKSSTTTQLNIIANHPITAGLAGTIDFVSSGAETFTTSSVYAGLTILATSANGVGLGNSAVFIAEAGQNVSPTTGESQAAHRRVMFPMTDNTFSALTEDGRTLFVNAINWLADLELVDPPIQNDPATDDVFMYNDHVAGALTHVNATTYSANGTSAGWLKNFATGENTGVTLSTAAVGVTFDVSSQFPAENADADDLFGGIIDFGSSSGASLEISGADSYTHLYSGLDPLSEYDFAGTAIRGNDSYANRWTLVTIVGADAFTPAHSVGEGVVTTGLLSDQVAIWVGANHNPGQGYVARWTDIDPGPDGEFEIVSRQYTGSIPASVQANGSADGSKSYGLTATRLVKSFSGLAVVQSDPEPGATFTAAPSTATLDFNLPVNTSTLNADDLRVDGVNATSFTVVDSDTVRWDLPSGIGAGDHLITLAAGVIESTDGRSFIGYSSPFSVAVVPSISNTPPANLLATTATVGVNVASTGFDSPSARLFWGDDDGGTNPASWDNVVELGTIDSGTMTTDLIGLTHGTTYFYRTRATNIAGAVWSPSTASFATPNATIPIITSGAASNVSAFSAEVPGQVVDIGNDPPTVRIYYGTTDGGTSPARWEYFSDVGIQTGAFNAFITGLEPETEYFYRAGAENLAGANWSTPTQAFTTTNLPPLLLNEIAGGDSDILPTRVRLDSSKAYRGDEITPDWIELFNPTPAAVDLSGFHLTDNNDNPFKWPFPAGTIVPGNGFLVVFATGENVRDRSFDESGRLHTNFTLTDSGEYLALTGSDGEVVHEYAPQFPRLREGFTFGLDTNGNERFFSNPTPDAVNDSSSIVAGFVADTRFSVDRGFFHSPITVEITSNTPGATIVYTRDGSEPTPTNGIQVTAPDAATVPVASVSVTTTTNLRARAYLNDWVPTNIDTHTYIFIDDVIQQPANPSGFPSSWGGAPTADYAMDPEIVNDARYTADLLAGLREIPTLSITSSVGDIFGGGGIYSNTSNSNLEVAASAELILQDGSTGFQVDAAFKIQGGASRNPNSSPKHALSLRFRDDIGDSTLNYPLFKDSPVTTFDSLQLRSMYNNSWIHWASEQRPRGTLIRDQWMRDALLDMGQVDAGRGSYMHLYINGLYWGVYNVHERAEAAHYAEYFGGTEGEYDALNAGSPIDGDLTSYNAMKATVATRDWNAIQQVLDIDNYIDWTIVQRFGSNSDLKVNNNWRAAGGGPNNAPWRFYSWDSERIFEGVNEGGPASDPPEILSTLSQIAEFRLRFADRVQMHFFADGALTPENVTERWMNRVNEIENAIVAESARWGDYRRDAHQRNCGCDLYDRDDDWHSEIQRLVNNYFPLRSNIVVNQYKDLGLYPSVDAATFQIDGVDQYGGEIGVGARLTFDAGANVYYTLDGSDPRAEGGAAVGVLYRPGIDAPITLTESTTVTARARSGSTWSALTTANFVVVPVEEAIVVTEINYHPHAPTDAETDVIANLNADDFEFIEVTNIHPTATINLLDMKFIDGVEFTFPNASLAAGQRAVVVEDSAAFQVRYGTDIQVLGQWAGGLSNNGERLALVDGIGNMMLDVEYSDRGLWPASADGYGATLVWNGEFSGGDAPINKHYSWSGSSQVGGSPSTGARPRVGVVINEVLANSDDFANGDTIELFNPGSDAIDIGGWYLSDNGNLPLKYQIPANTIIAPGDFVVFDENDLDFNLSGSNGDDVWLVISNGLGDVAGFVDEVEFSATVAGESVGLVNGILTPQTVSTLGCQNLHARVGPLVISEVHFNPGEPSAAALAIDLNIVEDDLEYVEIHNPTAATVELSEWRVRSGVDYNFAANTMLDAGESIVVISFNPENSSNADRVAAFLAHYGLNSGDVVLQGGFAGQLSDSGEAVRLRRPGAPPIDNPTLIPRLLEDEFIYDDLADGFSAADGSGASLQRVIPTAWGNADVSWAALTPTPGTVDFGGQLLGDVNADGLVNATDIDLVYDAARRGSTVGGYDVDRNGTVDQADGAFVVSNILDRLPADMNLDGFVDGSDFNIWNDHKFLDCHTGWAVGDVNGDSRTDGSDFNIWLEHRFTASAADDPVAAIRPPRAALQVNMINNHVQLTHPRARTNRFQHIEQQVAVDIREQSFDRVTISCGRRPLMQRRIAEHHDEVFAELETSFKIREQLRQPQR